MKAYSIPEGVLVKLMNIVAKLPYEQVAHAIKEVEASIKLIQEDINHANEVDTESA